MDTISVTQLSTLLADPALLSANIRVASRSINVGEYPGEAKLRKDLVEESGIYWMLLWPRYSMNTPGITKTLTPLNNPVDDIHYMRVLRLSSIAPSTKVLATNESNNVTEVTFDLKQGSLCFLDSKCVEREKQLDGILTVHANLSDRTLTFS